MSANEIDIVKKALHKGVISPDEAAGLLRNIEHNRKASTAIGIMNDQYRGKMAGNAIAPIIDELFAKTFPSRHGPFSQMEPSSIKDPDIDENGELKNKPKEIQHGIVCDSGWDWGFEEAMEYAKRPITKGETAI